MAGRVWCWQHVAGPLQSFSRWSRHVAPVLEAGEEPEDARTEAPSGSAAAMAARAAGRLGQGLLQDPPQVPSSPCP